MSNMVYVMRYALSGGIKRCELVRTYAGGAATVKWPGAVGGTQHVSDGEWCETPDGALKIAEQMRAKKIASLQKQIAKLEKLTLKLPGAQP